MDARVTSSSYCDSCDVSADRDITHRRRGAVMVNALVATKEVAVYSGPGYYLDG